MFPYSLLQITFFMPNIVGCKLVWVEIIVALLFLSFGPMSSCLDAPMHVLLGHPQIVC